MKKWAQKQTPVLELVAVLNDLSASGSTVFTILPTNSAVVFNVVSFKDVRV